MAWAPFCNKVGTKKARRVFFNVNAIKKKHGEEGSIYVVLRGQATGDAMPYLMAYAMSQKHGCEF